MLSGAKACNSCRSRQELSNEHLIPVFTCKLWRRHSLERASESLPNIIQKLENKLEKHRCIQATDGRGYAYPIPGDVITSSSQSIATRDRALYRAVAGLDSWNAYTADILRSYAAGSADSEAAAEEPVVHSAW